VDEIKLYQKMTKIILNEILNDVEDKGEEMNCKFKKYKIEDENNDQRVVHQVECTKIEETDVKLNDIITDKKFYEKDDFGYPKYKAEITISQIDDKHKEIKIRVSDYYDQEEWYDYVSEEYVMENMERSGWY